VLISVSHSYAYGMTLDSTRNNLVCIAMPLLLRHPAPRWEAAIRNRAMVTACTALLAFIQVIPVAIDAAELNPEAAQVFERYVQRTEQRLQTELPPGGDFLWVNSLPEARRAEAFAKLQRGEVMTERVAATNTAEVQAPGALIHHWIGTVFIPGASLQQALAVVQDYDHHQKYYGPQVARSKALEHTGDDFKVYFRLTRKKIVTVVLDTEYVVHYEHIDATRAQSRSYSTRIVEVEHPGEPNERQLPPGNDDGFLWRLDSFWRFAEADHGVYVQCEAISLTRDIPTGLGWLIGPFIESIPRESLEFTLRSTRAAVLRPAIWPQRSAK
jgi:hypothetical protein